MNLFDIVGIELPIQPKHRKGLYIGHLSEDVKNWTPQDPPSLDGIKDIELDCETDGLDYHGRDILGGIAIHFDGRTQYLPIRHRNGPNLDEVVVRRWAQRELRDKNITNLNTKFDVNVMFSFDVDLEEQGCTVSDVAHHAALLDDHRGTFNVASPGMKKHAKPFSLAALVADYLPDEAKVTKVGSTPLDGERMMEYPSGLVAIRAEADVRQVYKLRQIFRPKMGAEGLLEVLALENEVIYPVCEMERNGTHLDVELLEQWVKQSALDYEQGLDRITREAGLPRDLGTFNPDKGLHWEWLFQRLDIPIVHFTPQGAPSFTDEILKHIPHPLIQFARKISKLGGLRQKYLVPYSQRVRSDGLLFYELHQLKGNEYGTVSGRFSSSNPNIQQVLKPEKQIAVQGGSDEYLIRRLFIPRPGHRFFSADAKQIEYRLFAHYAKSEHILQAYRENPDVDFHNLVQDMIRKVMEGITRKRAKDTNFAKIYGAGLDKVAAMLELSREEAQKFVAVYDRTFPEADKLLKQAKRLAETRGWVKTLSGRRARFPGQQRTHKALNSVIQGSAADINKRKLVEVHRERKRTGFILQLTVHDELDGSVPSFKSARMVAEILDRQTTDLRVPILWDADVGSNWADLKKPSEEQFAEIDNVRAKLGILDSHKNKFTGYSSQ